MKKAIVLYVALVNFAHSVMASGASPEINWWNLGSEYKDAPALGWLAITFFIFVYCIFRAVRTPLSLYLETRSRDIRQQIEEGRLAKIESEKKLLLYDEKLRTLGQEIEKLKQNFAVQAASERKERERSAQEMEARISRDAEDTIRANVERTKNRLAEEAISRAVEMAGQTIAKNKREAVDDVLKQSFLVDLHDSAAEAKRESVMSAVLKGSKKNDLLALATEVN